MAKRNEGGIQISKRQIILDCYMRALKNRTGSQSQKRCGNKIEVRVMRNEKDRAHLHQL